MLNDAPRRRRFAAGSWLLLSAALVWAPTSLVAQATSPGTTATPATDAPRTVASTLLVEAVRASMESSARAVSTTPAESAPRPPEPRRATVDLGVRLAAARGGFVRVHRILTFEVGEVLRRVEPVIAPTARRLARGAATPSGLAVSVGMLGLVVLGPLVLGRDRRAPRRDPTATPDDDATTPPVAPHRPQGTTRFSDARSLVALGAPTSEICARTGVSQDLLDTMRRLHAAATADPTPTSGVRR